MTDKLNCMDVRSLYGMATTISHRLLHMRGGDVIGPRSVPVAARSEALSFIELTLRNVEFNEFLFLEATIGKSIDAMALACAILNRVQPYGNWSRASVTKELRRYYQAINSMGRSRILGNDMLSVLERAQCFFDKVRRIGESQGAILPPSNENGWVEHAEFR